MVAIKLYSDKAFIGVSSVCEVDLPHSQHEMPGKPEPTSN